jgi:hypothetical protein
VSHPCDLTDPLSCGAAIISGVTGSAAGNAVSTGWDIVCKSFADAAAQLLAAFGRAFAALPEVRLSSAGIAGTYGIALAIAGSVAALLIFGQVIRTVWTHDGSALAEALTGTGKAVLAWLVTAAVASAALTASDEVTRFIVASAFGSQQALAARLGNLVNWAIVAGYPGQAAIGGALLLVFALIGIVLVVVLWFELLLRNAAIALLIAVSPIAATGQISETTKVWWQRTVSAVVQLVILKPVIALVFAVGLGMAGASSGIQALLAGLLVLALAAFAWPVIARFFTFTTIQASGYGLAGFLGFAAGAASRAVGGRGTAGINPAQWSMAAEQRTMTAHSMTGGAASPGGTGSLPGASAAGGVAGGADTPSGGGGAAVAAGIGWALQKASQAGATLAGQMEQTAAHAGMSGAYPYSTVPGGPRVGPGGPRHYPVGGAPGRVELPALHHDAVPPDEPAWPEDRPDEGYPQ